MAETENLSAGETPPDAEQIAGEAIRDEWTDPMATCWSMGGRVVAALREAGYLSTPGAPVHVYRERLRRVEKALDEVTELWEQERRAHEALRAASQPKET